MMAHEKSMMQIIDRLLRETVHAQHALITSQTLKNEKGAAECAGARPPAAHDFARQCHTEAFDYELGMDIMLVCA